MNDTTAPLLFALIVSWDNDATKEKKPKWGSKCEDLIYLIRLKAIIYLIVYVPANYTGDRTWPGS